MSSNSSYTGKTVWAVSVGSYSDYGNTEWLMDVANFAMIEFLRPTHEEAHFRATDSDESPGVALWVGGHAKDRIADHRDSA